MPFVSKIMAIPQRQGSDFVSIVYSPTPTPTPSPTHSPTHPLTYSLTHSCTYPPTHSLTHPPTHTFPHPPTPSLTHSPTYSLTHSLTHSLPPSPTHSLSLQLQGLVHEGNRGGVGGATLAHMGLWLFRLVYGGSQQGITGIGRIAAYPVRFTMSITQLGSGGSLEGWGWF